MIRNKLFHSERFVFIIMRDTQKPCLALRECKQPSVHKKCLSAGVCTVAVMSSLLFTQNNLFWFALFCVPLLQKLQRCVNACFRGIKKWSIVSQYLKMTAFCRKNITYMSLLEISLFFSKFAAIAAYYVLLIKPGTLIPNKFIPTEKFSSDLHS